MPVHVNADTFARAESDRMFFDLQRVAGGVNAFGHSRQPTPIEQQTVIRMNRDTLYSFAVVDISRGATLTLPEHEGRYLSAMVVNNDHYINRTFYDPGEHRLTVDEFDTEYVLIALRILVDPADPADVAGVAALQDRVGLTAVSARPFELPDYDTASFDATRQALLALSRQMARFERAFGRRDEVDPVRHLIGTAAGWGGLPDKDASYVNVVPEGSGNRALVMRDVPVDAFWSVSVYNAQGFFEPNDRDAYTLNNITGVHDPDGAVTVRFGDWPAGTPNVLPTPDGWSFVVRLYRPRAAILDGSWTVPTLQPA